MPKKKSGMQLFSPFLLNLYAGACLHNEKYARILCSSVLKRFSAGLHKDTSVRRELARVPALGSAGGLHGEGERSGGFFLPLRASNALEHSTSISLFVAIKASLQTSQKYSGLNPKLSVSDATKTF